MTFDKSLLEAAHAHCACHREEIQTSKACGCFACCSTFDVGKIESWWEETSGEYATRTDRWTALCPECGLDCVIGDASNMPIADPKFLAALNAYWVGGTIRAAD